MSTIYSLGMGAAILIGVMIVCLVAMVVLVLFVEKVFNPLVDKLPYKVRRALAKFWTLCCIIFAVSFLLGWAYVTGHDFLYGAPHHV